MGTSHSIQEGSQAPEAFRALVSGLHSKDNFVLIAEEAHESTNTVAKVFCAENSLGHVCIDPDRDERAILNILTFEQVAFRIMDEFGKEYPEITFWPREPSEDTLPTPVWERYQELMRHSFDAREAVWLDRILIADQWPCLCIIGADHFPSFANLLSRAGIVVSEVHKDWKP